MRLRFTIRDLFWLSLTLALLIAWSVEHYRVGKMSKLHYWVDPGTLNVHFTHGIGTDGAHKFQGYIDVETLKQFRPDHIQYE